MNRDKSCSEEQLVLYHYGELEPVDRQLLEAHLKDCAVCRANLEELKESLARMPQRELRLTDAEKRSFAEAVTARARRHSPRRLAGWGSALAAGALAVSIVMLRPGEQVVPPTPSGSALTDFEMLEQFDLLQELDLLQNLELLEEMEERG